jgi:hypothetical protein
MSLLSPSLFPSFPSAGGGGLRTTAEPTTPAGKGHGDAYESTCADGY